MATVEMVLQFTIDPATGVYKPPLTVFNGGKRRKTARRQAKHSLWVGHRAAHTALPVAVTRKAKRHTRGGFSFFKKRFSFFKKKSLKNMNLREYQKLKPSKKRNSFFKLSENEQQLWNRAHDKVQKQINDGIIPQWAVTENTLDNATFSTWKELLKGPVKAATKKSKNKKQQKSLKNMNSREFEKLNSDEREKAILNLSENEKQLWNNARNQYQKKINDDDIIPQWVKTKKFLDEGTFTTWQRLLKGPVEGPVEGSVKSPVKATTKEANTVNELTARLMNHYGSR